MLKVEKNNYNPNLEYTQYCLYQTDEDNNIIYRCNVKTHKEVDTSIFEKMFQEILSNMGFHNALLYLEREIIDYSSSYSVYNEKDLIKIYKRIYNNFYFLKEMKKYLKVLSEQIGSIHCHPLEFLFPFQHICHFKRNDFYHAYDLYLNKNFVFKKFKITDCGKSRYLLSDTIYALTKESAISRHIRNYPIQYQEEIKKRSDDLQIEEDYREVLIGREGIYYKNYCQEAFRNSEIIYISNDSLSKIEIENNVFNMNEVVETKWKHRDSAWTWNDLLKLNEDNVIKTERFFAILEGQSISEALEEIEGEEIYFEDYDE